ncbi:UPF0175 family protein [Haloarchaeobius amylolyticus]|uniref:UPF0175 family protein n=1 Tax=Haloarchaeobius amylolyticus TaxID=1198296 RepID=UPI0022700688|nr:UPF0175 family protein [Haloarchaeobius amylolyticus]
MAIDHRNDGPQETGKLATAIGLYILGEISLGKAAERVGITRWEMEDLLDDLGIDARYGPKSREELDSEVDVALNLDTDSE